VEIITKPHLTDFERLIIHHQTKSHTTTTITTTSMSLDASLDLLRRLPPSKTAHNLSLLQSLLPEDVTAELLQSIDQPLSTRTCTKTGREYLLCDYNRDGDSYRSPWSGEWEPKIDDPVVLDESIRELEVKANDAFDSYREL
jgi:capping protein (actin filament) muscle Z-line, beta